MFARPRCVLYGHQQIQLVDDSRTFFMEIPQDLPVNLTQIAFIDEDNIYSLPLSVPFYFAMRQNLFGGIPDNILALATPVTTYWTASLFFYCLDESGWTWLDKYRIHESDEVKSRNHATPLQVFRSVIFQHAIQTFLGYYWLSDPPKISLSQCTMEMEAVGRTLARFVGWAAGPDATKTFLDADIIYWLYWWGIPTSQLFFSLFVIDTWQYFIHRWMHSNRYLYKIHAVHHRLHVPYAFGASYGHPLEGFLFDCVSFAIAEFVTNLSIRQCILLYIIGSIKTVNDHCGYTFPYDPFQMFSGNNADFHDIHHQAIGLKFNFSQPFFVHWDVILGTRMTRNDMERRKYKWKTV